MQTCFVLPVTSEGGLHVQRKRPFLRLQRPLVASTRAGVQTGTREDEPACVCMGERERITGGREGGRFQGSPSIRRLARSPLPRSHTQSDKVTHTHTPTRVRAHTRAHAPVFMLRCQTLQRSFLAHAFAVMQTLARSPAAAPV